MEPETLLIIAGFIIFAIFIVCLAILSARKTEAKCNAKLSSLGFTRCTERMIKKDVTEHLKIVRTYQQGKRLLLNLYQLKITEGDIYFCDYRFSSASGKTGGSSALLICLIEKNLQCPRFTINSRPQGSKFLTKIFETLSAGLVFPDMELIDSIETGLSNQFRVYVNLTQKKQFLAILPEIYSVIVSKAGIGIDAKDDTIILSDVMLEVASIPNKEIDIKKIKDLIDIVKLLAKKLN